MRTIANPERSCLPDFCIGETYRLIAHVPIHLFYLLVYAEYPSKGYILLMVVDNFPLLENNCKLQHQLLTTHFTGSRLDEDTS
jgi:hypothetical protein